MVDGLNLAHWLEGRAEFETIISTIDRTAPVLRARHPGTVVYVFKDRDTEHITPEQHAQFSATAIRNKVHIAIAEKYPEPISRDIHSSRHSAKGRDDFYMSLMAHRYKCAAITADHLRDFAQFRTDIQPFLIVEYSYWRMLPQRDYIRPQAAAYAHLRKPVTLHPDLYFDTPTLNTTKRDRI